MPGTQLLKHYKLNCTVYWTMIVSGPLNFIGIVCWIFYYFIFKTSYEEKNQNSMRAHVWYITFAILQIKLYRVVDYDSKWSTKFHKDYMLESF